jgi:hypothetical protein
LPQFGIERGFIQAGEFASKLCAFDHTRHGNIVTRPGNDAPTGAARAGALSSLLVALFAAFGLVLQHGELDFLLHVVNAVNDYANFVADGIGLL